MLLIPNQESPIHPSHSAVARIFSEHYQRGVSSHWFLDNVVLITFM